MHHEPIIYGTHILADMYIINREFLTNKDILGSLLVDSAWKSGATVIDSCFYQFPNTNGITGILLLSESHMAVHTWPENDFIAFDIFTCGNANPIMSLNHFEKVVGVLRTDVHTVKRGDLCRSMIR